VTRLLREPLLHFLLGGAVLFGVYGSLQGGRSSSPTEVVVSRGQVRSLQMQFERLWQRPATRDELRGLVDGWVKEEIFYREGIAMALDRDDPIIRRRVGQKLEFILDSAAPASPTDTELQSWLDAHPGDYQTEPTYSLRQVFFNPARHGDTLDGDIAAARRALESGNAIEGDTTLLPPAMNAARATEVARVFGNEFAEGLAMTAIGGWHGPMRSAFGVHLVELSERRDGSRATLQDVRAQVERDLLHARTENAKAAVYERLRANYRVRIDDTGIAASPGG
jgi:parvulin-like peptidyl-prolyl cis-trans isomerase-like protein